MKTINIPNSNDTSNRTLDVEKNLIIVGANGSGKSRFGAKLEQTNNPSKRISAQRYLQLNEVVQKQDFETADNQLRSSYKNQPPIQPQNDYQQVLISLFAQESRRDSEYVEKSRDSNKKLEIPKSVKEKVIDVWNFVFPYMELKMEKDRVKALNDSNEFSGVEMSDGEKVGLYLISQILLAEKNCILIIDEPELHLHKALMVRLWNKLEESRNDCTFIYITHDLDFAVSKPASKIIWTQGYKNSLCSWKELDPNEAIPENLYLEVLGSREPVLFVEGEKGSLDVQIYQAYYENFTVIPRGSCEEVIQSVKGLKNNENLHDKKVYGLIDRDFRTEEQLASLKGEGIFSLTLHEVENLFLLPEIIQIVCEHLSKNDKVEEVNLQIIELYKTQKESVKFLACKYQMHRVINQGLDTVKDQEGYNQFKKSIFSEIDQLFSKQPLLSVSEDLDVIEILKVYPHKGLVKQVQNKLELTGNGYINLFMSFFTSDKRQKIINALKAYLPEINQ